MREPEPLRISIDGARPEELARGLAAARHVFEGIGATAAECAAAAWRRELLDTAGVYAAADRVFRLKEVGGPVDELAQAEAELAELHAEPYQLPLTEREAEIADYWDGADRAAVRACCFKWPNPPTTARLTTLTEEQEAQVQRERAELP